MDDDRLSMESKTIMYFLLRLPDDWNHCHMVQILCRKFKKSDPTIRKYLAELCQCGYLHRFLVTASCRGGVVKWEKTYKISELPQTRPDGYSWDQWIPLSGHHARQVQSQSRLPGHRRKTFGLLKAPASGPSKIFGTYKGETRRDLHSSDLYSQRIPLPLQEKGDHPLDAHRVECEKPQVSRTSRTKASRMVVSNPKQSTPAKPRLLPFCPAAFNASRRAAVFPADGFASFLTDWHITYPEAVAALQRAGKAASSAWLDAVLANPLVAMLQQVLGYRHWDFHSLRKQVRRLRRGTLLPWEVVNLWCAQQAESSPTLVRDAKPLLESGDFRNTPFGQFDIRWDERMRLIRNSLTDAMLEPLLAESRRMVSFSLENPSYSSTDEGRDVHDQAAWWLFDREAKFFTQHGAREWFLRTLERNAPFFAGLHPAIASDALPEDLRAILDERVARVTEAELQSWRDSVIAKVPLIPGGFHRNMLDAIRADRLFTPDHIVAPIMRAIMPALPVGAVDMPEHHHLLDVGDFCSNF